MSLHGVRYVHDTSISVLKTSDTFQLLKTSRRLQINIYMINKFDTVFYNITLNAAVIVDECSQTIDASYSSYILCHGQIVTTVRNDPHFKQY